MLNMDEGAEIARRRIAETWLLAYIPYYQGGNAGDSLSTSRTVTLRMRSLYLKVNPVILQSYLNMYVPIRQERNV